MGDRTTVTLLVLASQAEAAKQLFGRNEIDDECSDGSVHSFTFYEVNYGELDFLSELREAGIAYDSSWDDGSEYKSGTASCRFTPNGGVVEKELYDSSLNPNLDSLLKHIDDPVRLRQTILDHKEKVSTLLLDSSQEAYGRLYRARQLIGLPIIPE